MPTGDRQWLEAPWTSSSMAPAHGLAPTEAWSSGDAALVATVERRARLLRRIHECGIADAFVAEAAREYGLDGSVEVAPTRSWSGSVGNPAAAAAGRRARIGDEDPTASTAARSAQRHHQRYQQRQLPNGRQGHSGHDQYGHRQSLDQCLTLDHDRLHASAVPLIALGGSPSAKSRQSKRMSGVSGTDAHGHRRMRTDVDGGQQTSTHACGASVSAGARPLAHRKGDHPCDTAGALRGGP